VLAELVPVQTASSSADIDIEATLEHVLRMCCSALLPILRRAAALEIASVEGQVPAWISAA